MLAVVLVDLSYNCLVLVDKLQEQSGGGIVGGVAKGNKHQKRNMSKTGKRSNEQLNKQQTMKMQNIHVKKRGNKQMEFELGLAGHTQ